MNLAQVIDAELVRSGRHRLPTTQGTAETRRISVPDEPAPAKVGRPPKYPAVKSLVLEALADGPTGSRHIIAFVLKRDPRISRPAIFGALKTLLRDSLIEADDETPRNFSIKERK